MDSIYKIAEDNQVRTKKTIHNVHKSLKKPAKSWNFNKEPFALENSKLS